MQLKSVIVGRSLRWKDARSRDVYVKNAARLGLRSRSYFKLEELDQKYQILKLGQRVLDLGATPGGWSQYSLTRVGDQGIVVAADILAMKPLKGVKFVHCDINERHSINSLCNAINGQKFEVVMSDMAPNITGNPSIDANNYAKLYESIFRICHSVLSAKGTLVFKIFQDESISQIKAKCIENFTQCRFHKPKASLPNSKEIYLIASNYQTSD